MITPNKPAPLPKDNTQWAAEILKKFYATYPDFPVDMAQVQWISKDDDNGKGTLLITASKMPFAIPLFVYNDHLDPMDLIVGPEGTLHLLNSDYIQTIYSNMQVGTLQKKKPVRWGRRNSSIPNVVPPGSPMQFTKLSSLQISPQTMETIHKVIKESPDLNLKANYFPKFASLLGDIQKAVGYRTVLDARKSLHKLVKKASEVRIEKRANDYNITAYNSDGTPQWTRPVTEKIARAVATSVLPVSKASELLRTMPSGDALSLYPRYVKIASMDDSDPNNGTTLRVSVNGKTGFYKIAGHTEETYVGSLKKGDTFFLKLGENLYSEPMKAEVFNAYGKNTDLQAYGLTSKKLYRMKTHPVVKTAAFVDNKILMPEYEKAYKVVKESPVYKTLTDSRDKIFTRKMASDLYRISAKTKEDKFTKIASASNAEITLRRLGLSKDDAHTVLRETDKASSATFALEKTAAYKEPRVITFKEPSPEEIKSILKVAAAMTENADTQPLSQDVLVGLANKTELPITSEDLEDINQQILKLLYEAHQRDTIVPLEDIRRTAARIADLITDLKGAESVQDKELPENPQAQLDTD